MNLAISNRWFRVSLIAGAILLSDIASIPGCASFIESAFIGSTFDGPVPTNEKMSILLHNSPSLFETTVTTINEKPTPKFGASTKQLLLVPSGATKLAGTHRQRETVRFVDSNGKSWRDPDIHKFEATVRLDGGYFYRLSMPGINNIVPTENGDTLPPDFLSQSSGLLLQKICKSTNLLELSKTFVASFGWLGNLSIARKIGEENSGSAEKLEKAEVNCESLFRSEDHSVLTPDGKLFPPATVGQLYADKCIREIDGRPPAPHPERVWFALLPGQHTLRCVNFLTVPVANETISFKVDPGAFLKIAVSARTSAHLRFDNGRLDFKSEGLELIVK